MGRDSSLDSKKVREKKKGKERKKKEENKKIRKKFNDRIKST